jgi:malonyl-CoA O-methyltransferase
MKAWLARLLRTAPPTVLPSLEAYARWAAAYPPQAHNALMQAEERAMRSLLPDPSGLCLLDLACGTGRYGLLAGQMGAGRVVSLDNSLPMLRANPLIECACADTEGLPLRNACMDGVMCGLALGHLPRLGLTFAEVRRVLKPGGWLLMSDVHPFIFLNGAQRTFQADGRTYAVEHYPHLIADYQAAASGVGLRLEAIAEPPLAPDVLGSVAVSRLPVALVMRWVAP